MQPFPLFVFAVLISHATGVFAQESKIDKRIAISEIAGSQTTYIGILGAELGTPLIVDATIERPNTKTGDTYMIVTAVNGKAIEASRFILRVKGEGLGRKLPDPTSTSRKYRVCESAVFLGGHQAIYHTYKPGTTTIESHGKAAMRPFHLAPVLILIPD